MGARAEIKKICFAACTLRLREQGKSESLDDSSHRAFQLKQKQPPLEES